MEEYHLTIKDRILLESQNGKNNNIKISKNKSDSKKETEQYDETIIPTNSCFDDQSFFLKECNKKLNDNKTNLTKVTHDLVTNLFNNNPKNLNYDDLLHLQNFAKNDFQLNNNKKTINDFIKRNNYIKENHNNCNHDYEEEDEDSDMFRESNLNINRDNNDYLLIIQQFLEREKKFENKLIADKERRMLMQDIDLLNNYQDKPSICEKSSKLAFKKNKNTKVYDRLYANAFSADKKSKYYEYNNNISLNKSNNFKKNIKTNLQKHQNINISNKFNDNRRYELSKDDSLNNNDNNNLNGNISKNNFIKRSYSQNKIKKNNTLKIYNKVDYKYRNLVKKENKDKLFNEYNSQSATEKMCIVKINKINYEIDNLLSTEKMDTNKYGINFNIFCDLLFKLGYVYILHTKKDINNSNNNNNIKNNDINDNLENVLIQPYLDKSLVTKDFIINELIIINEAFNSIINNFKISQELNNKDNSNNNIETIILQNSNKKIQIEEFKFFIFILAGVFIGYKNEIQKIETKYNNKSTHSNKTNKTTTTNVSNISRDDKNKNFIKMYNLLKKIVPNIKINNFSVKDTLDYKTYFNYMINVKNNHIIFLNNEKNNIKKEKLEECILSSCTFTPKTNRNKESILNSIKPNMNFEERNMVLSKKKSKHKMDLQKEINQEFIELYPFSPKLNGDKSIEYLKKMKQKYQKEKEKNNKNNINIINPKEEENKSIVANELANPKLNKPLKKKMFSQSPLAKDKLFNDKIKNMRACNFTKQLKNFENNTREVLSNDIKNNKILINYLLNNVIEGRMNLAIENQSNKDITFDKFKKRKTNSCDENGYKGNYLEILNLKNNYPLFCMEVKIQNENQIIEVFPNDDYEKLCMNFCVEHKLGKDSYNTILESIKKKIREINNYSI